MLPIRVDHRAALERSRLDIDVRDPLEPVLDLVRDPPCAGGQLLRHLDRAARKNDRPTEILGIDATERHDPALRVDLEQPTLRELRLAVVRDLVDLAATESVEDLPVLGDDGRRARDHVPAPDADRIAEGPGAADVEGEVRGRVELDAGRDRFDGSVGGASPGGGGEGKERQEQGEQATPKKQH